MNARAIVLSVLFVVVCVIPSQAHAEEKWGALLMDRNHLDFEHDRYGRPTKNATLVFFAGMSWDFPSRKEAFEAAKKACMNEFRKYGSKVRYDSCGIYEEGRKYYEITGFLFTNGECAAYASGQLIFAGDTKNKKHAMKGSGLARSKEKAEERAMRECLGSYMPVQVRSNTCKIQMSACIK